MSLPWKAYTSNFRDIYLKTNKVLLYFIGVMNTENKFHVFFKMITQIYIWFFYIHIENGKTQLIFRPELNNRQGCWGLFYSQFSYLFIDGNKRWELRLTLFFLFLDEYSITGSGIVRTGYLQQEKNLKRTWGGFMFMNKQFHLVLSKF